MLLWDDQNLLTCLLAKLLVHINWSTGRRAFSYAAWPHKSWICNTPSVSSFRRHL